MPDFAGFCRKSAKSGREAKPQLVPAGSIARKGIPYFRLTPDEWAKEVAIVKTWSANRADVSELA